MCTEIKKLEKNTERYIGTDAFIHINLHSRYMIPDLLLNPILMDYSFFLFVKLYDYYFTEMDVLQTPYDEQYDIYQRWYRLFTRSRYNTVIWYGQGRSEYDCMIDFLEECSLPFVVKMDGIIMKFCNDENEAFRYVHDNQSQSFDWATKYGGWEVVEL